MRIFLNLPDALDPVPVTNLFDISGDDVETWDEARTFVAGPLPGGGWLAAECADYRVAAEN